MSDLEQIVKADKQFKDVSAYVTYILEQVVVKKRSAATTTTTVTPPPSANYSKADEDKIRERLKNLGYLD